MSAPLIYLGGNDWLIEVDLTRPATTTGESEAAAGLSNIIGLLSATPDGATIHASLSVSLTERSATPGRYYGVVQGADIVTHLTAYAGTFVYERVGDAANLQTGAPRKVVTVRPPDA